MPTTTAPAPSVSAIFASVQRQYWDRNDYAVDAAQLEHVDVTAMLASWPTTDLMALKDNHENSDQVFLDAVDAGLTDAWNGPFYVTLSSSIMGHLLATRAQDALVTYAQLHNVTAQMLDTDVRSTAPGSAAQALAGGIEAQVAALLEATSPLDVLIGLECLTSR